MYELHENEQYFFAEPTLTHLAGFLAGFATPCCLCAPLVGRRLAEQGVAVTILDIDERFATVPGFRRYNLYRPEWLDQEFDIIVCDPPFFNVSLSQLFAAIRLISHNRFDQLSTTTVGGHSGSLCTVWITANGLSAQLPNRTSSGAQYYRIFRQPGCGRDDCAQDDHCRIGGVCEL